MLVGHAPIGTWSPEALCVCGVALALDNLMRTAKAELVEVEIGQMWWICHISALYLFIPPSY
jgi:hypothetical protein